MDDRDVYWGAGGGVDVAPVAGGTPTLLPVPWQDVPTVMALSGGILYGRGYTDTVVAVPVDGSAPKVLVSRPNIDPTDLTVDGTSIYWTSRASGVVLKAPLAGGCPTTLYSSPGTSVFNIAVDATNIYWINADSAGKLMKLTPK